MMVYLVVFDKAAYTLSDKLFKSIETYIDDNYVEKRTERQRRNRDDEVLHQIREMTSSDEDGYFQEILSAPSAPKNFDDVVNHIGESFTEMLLRLIKIKWANTARNK